MDDQAGEEEADQQRRAQIDAALIGRRRAREAEEEEEAAEEQRRVVRVEDRPGHEQHVHRRHPRRHRQELAVRHAVGVLVGPLDVRDGGTRASAAARGGRARSRQASTSTIATTARQPKCASMNGVSQPQGRATISTGGAAKWVSVPPIETLTNSRPSVAYFSRGLGLEIVELARRAAARRSSSPPVR